MLDEEKINANQQQGNLKIRILAVIDSGTSIKNI